MYGEREAGAHDDPVQDVDDDHSGVSGQSTSSGTLYSRVSACANAGRGLTPVRSQVMTVRWLTPMDAAT